MTDLAQKRINFIELLHDAFIVHKGHGAFAYISVTEVLTLLDQYLDSHEPAEHYINQYMRSI